MRAHPAFTVAAAALIALLPLQAAAQEVVNEGDGNISVRDRARPEFDPLGKRLGGFDLNASADLGAESNDNVYATDTLEQSDVILTAAARARLASHWSRHSLAAEAGVTRLDYQDFSTDDTTDWYAGADGRLDVYRATEFGGGVRVAEAHEPRTNPDSPLIAPSPVEFTRNEAYAYARHAFNRLRITARAATSDYDFDDVGGVDQDYRDYNEMVGSARVELAISPRIAALAEIAANERDYDFPGRDSNGRAYLVGASVNLTRVLTGEVTVGKFDQDYDDPAIGKVDGVAFNANLHWFPTELTTISANAARSAEESATLGASYINSVAGLRIDHELRRNVLLTAGVTSRKREYTGVARDDDTLSMDVGATYLVNRRIRVRGGFARDRNESTGVGGRDFEVNRVFAAISLHL